MKIGTLKLFNSKKRGVHRQTTRIYYPHRTPYLGILLDFETKNDAPSTLSTQEIRKLFGLTERECEIISMLSTGAEDKEIVEAPCISGSTFKKHLYNAYKKMDVNSRTQLFNTLAAAKKSAAH